MWLCFMLIYLIRNLYMRFDERNKWYEVLVSVFYTSWTNHWWNTSFRIFINLTYEKSELKRELSLFAAFIFPKWIYQYFWSEIIVEGTTQVTISHFWLNYIRLIHPHPRTSPFGTTDWRSFFRRVSGLRTPLPVILIGGVDATFEAPATWAPPSWTASSTRTWRKWRSLSGSASSWSTSTSAWRLTSNAKPADANPSFTSTRRPRSSTRIRWSILEGGWDIAEKGP